MTDNERRLTNVVQILILELEHAYHGLHTLPKQHSAVEAVAKANALLREVGAKS